MDNDQVPSEEALLRHQIALLTAENKRVHAALKKTSADLQSVVAQFNEIERLKAKIESNRKLYAARDRANEKDAERYRWLRQMDKGASWDGLLNLPFESIRCAEDIDKAIDVAMGGKEDAQQ